MAIGAGLAGATAILSGRRRDMLNETADELARLTDTRGACEVVVCDVTNSAEVESSVSAIAAKLGSVYGLVNNAALPQPSGSPVPLQQLSSEQWDLLMSTNVLGPWQLTKQLLPNMLVGGAVRVLFITSEAGWASTAGFGPYNVSKAALNSLSASFAEEVGSANPDLDIQINGLIPGEAKTEMNQGSKDSPFTVVPMALALLSHPPGGPNGHHFHRDGRHFEFAYSTAYSRSLL